MKTVAVYFTHPASDGPPFNEAEYRESYAEFAARIAGKGHRFCIVRSAETHKGKGVFSGGWEWQGGAWARVEAPIRTDVLLDKGEDLRFNDGTIVVNEPTFGDLCTHKEDTYAMFEEFMPKTVLCPTPEELVARLDQIPSELVVAKPPDGACGRGVIIGKREEILAATHFYPLMLQEFIDTSAGIPGIMTGTHDSRIVFVGGKVAYAEYKIPKSGSLISNVSLGGSYFRIADKDIPQEEMALASAVDDALSAFPTRVYSIDMCRGSDGRWRLIELNAPPALIATAGIPEYERYHEQLAELLIGCCR